MRWIRKPKEVYYEKPLVAAISIVEILDRIFAVNKSKFLG